ncbi:DUF815 domain-containing protein [Limisalsivibrio acetivorans]|uniref:DUF815 domain-containing protein n=1 Tax=Limisalsivibrio acetivorans TaxID=1304888 RepID=UPI0003B6D280|nr:DUF815 domain-containing protein [Limisalsivibrio acetivorans]
MNRPAAYRWKNGGLEPIGALEDVYRTDLVALERQIDLITANIESFIETGFALDILLWGERGAGKSSIIKMVLTEYAEKGLRAVEFRQEDIADIHDLYAVIRKDPELRFLIYFDDISFDSDDILFRRFKSTIEGGLETKPANCIFTATSNMRHMVRESAADTEDIYDRDAANERTSLFARFGLSVGFYPVPKKDYLAIAEHYLNKLDVRDRIDWEREAENFAINRGGRSGRIAKQFAVWKLIESRASKDG